MALSSAMVAELKFKVKEEREAPSPLVYQLIAAEMYTSQLKMVIL
jgi:hypothetical protein